MFAKVLHLSTKTMHPTLTSFAIAATSHSAAGITRHPPSSTISSTSLHSVWMPSSCMCGRCASDTAISWARHRRMWRSAPRRQTCVQTSCGSRTCAPMRPPTQSPSLSGTRRTWRRCVLCLDTLTQIRTLLMVMGERLLRVEQQLNISPPSGTVL